ncbi:MAG: glutathione synthetase [Thermoanaerobaculia bacterium]|nr:glutathione synthetase [Thermoanaerobaculia bacterium]
MNLAIVVNDIGTEEPNYTTTRVAMRAISMGHEVWTIGVGDFVASGEEGVQANARSTPAGKTYKKGETYLESLRSESARRERIEFDDVDIVLLRSDPAEDAEDRPWAQLAPLLFAQLAVRRGTIVLNDPGSLANALNKTYFEHFPESVRPRTLITRDPEEVKTFIESENGTAVLKPLQGSGGRNVFLLREKDHSNVNQIIEAILRDGYVVAQEFLEEAVKGDVRMFVMNGHPLEVDGQICAYRRVNRTGDIRSNITAGGEVESVEVTDEMLEIVNIVRPKLIRDGMWLVGLDIVGSKLMEVNVFSPGGLGSAEFAGNTDFVGAIVESLENKLMQKRLYGRNINNVALATV